MISTNRRQLLQSSAALGLLGLPNVWLQAGEGASSGVEEGILVVVQLSGGNDGLNTVIPYRQDAYYKARPALAIENNTALPLSGTDVALHPRLTGLQQLYQQSALSIVNGVGYPNPDRSHFRSMDIWHTAEPDKARQGTAGLDGWLTPCLNAETAALHIGDERQPWALAGGPAVPSIGSLDFLQRLSSPTGKGIRSTLQKIHRSPRREPTESVRRLAMVTLQRLERLIDIIGNKVPVDYPGSKLGTQLRMTGQLIAGDYPNRIYYLNHGGFDTHANQARIHADLLGDLGDGLWAFYQHLQAANRHQRVTVLVFSEFGRRLAQNGSFGTDHGAAAPAMLIGHAAKAGVHGPYPSLTDLDDGDLKYAVDYRSLYHTALHCSKIAAPPLLQQHARLW